MPERVFKEPYKKLIVIVVALAVIISTISAVLTITGIKYITEPAKAEEAPPLLVKAFADKTVGPPPFEVNFTSLVLYYEGYAAYHWDFGDGNTSNETSPTHNYTEEGTYICNLTVTDITGESVTTSVSIKVMANAPPTAVALVSPTSSSRPYKPGLNQLSKKQLYFLIKFLDSTSSPLLDKPGDITGEAQVWDPEGDEIVSYKWILEQPSINILGTEIYPKFTFEEKNLTTITFPELYTYTMGGYTITLTVTDAAGNTASDIKKFIVGISDVEGRINKLGDAWEGMWGVDFNQQKEPVQKFLLNIWLLFGPIHNFTDDMMEKILSQLPPEIGDEIYKAYYTLIWDKIDKDYHRPNWNPPNIPSDPSPADDATDVPFDAALDLSWECDDPDYGDGIKYDIYFGQTLPPPLVKLDSKTTTYTLVTMQSNTTYYWNIVAKDDPVRGTPKTTIGPVWSFRTATVK